MKTDIIQVALYNQSPNIFISIYSSKPSYFIDFNGEYLHLRMPFLKFNAFSILSDLTFFDRLIEKNPYFNSIGFIDLGDRNSYERVFSEIRSGIMKEKIEKYHSLLNELQIPTIGEFLKRWM